MQEPNAPATDLSRYAQAVAYLESLLRPSTGRVSEEQLRVHFERMGYLLDRLGNPQQRFPSVHVAGTSGKGSTTAIIGAILRASGLRTGVHCTPYVQTPIERMQIGERYASAREFVQLVDALRPHIAHMHERSPYGDVSYREIAVAQAFMYFAEAAVEIAAVETGMGGRYDYTNYVHPFATVIVTVDYDHIAALGPTLEKIAYHKAGIIKEGVIVVSGATVQPALGVIQREARAKHARLLRLGREVMCHVRSSDESGSTFDYKSPWNSLAGLHVGMLGRHQATNAALAVAAVESLRERGYRIGEDAIREGVAQARVPARLEIIQREPLIVLDGAHNPEKMRSLAAALEQIFPGRRPVLVAGVLAAKQADETLAQIVPLASKIIVTTPQVLDKAAVPPTELAEVVRRLGGDAIVEADLWRAIQQAKSLAGADGLVCVTGSLYMVGQARGLWVPPATIVAERTSFPTSL